MEYIVGLAVLVAAWFVFFRKKEEAVVEVQPEVAPYKVETPEAKVEAVNAQPVVAEVKPEKKPAGARKAAATAKAADKAAKKAPAKKPAASKAKAPAKKPKAPKA